MESYNAQGGAWYSNGGEKIEFGDVPDWVWNEARQMDKGYRQMYRIVLPEEKQRGEIVPTFEQSPDWPTQTDIVKALGLLDPAADTDWTEDGRPNLMSLKRVLGAYVTRAKLEAVAPNFIRPVVNEDA